MRTYQQHIFDALQVVGRPSDSRLTDLCNNVFIDNFYDELNNCRGGNNSLNCARRDFTFVFTNVHDGMLTLPMGFRAPIRVRLIDAAANNMLYDLEQRDYFIAERIYPPSTSRGIPAIWAWRRRGVPTGGTIAGVPTGEYVEVFPKPDRTLNGTFSYYGLLTKTTPATTNELILQQWGSMLHNYLVMRCFKDLGEHGDSQQYEREFRRWLQQFAEWDDDLRMGDDNLVEQDTRAGYYDGALFGG